MFRSPIVVAIAAALALIALNPSCTCGAPKTNEREDVGNGFVGEGEGASSEGEGASSEGEGGSSEGEGASSEGEGASSSSEGEGASSEGEGSSSSSDGEGASSSSEGEGASSSGEGEGASSSGEGEGATGEGEGEGSDGAGDVWLQIDYSHAPSSDSPDFTFSPTPGFTGSSWAFDGADFPQAWDRFNDMSVDDDPIGHSLDLSDELQLMIGLHTLTSYDHAVVRIEGRAASVDADTQFDVENPLNGCGVSGVTMSNDWTVHVVDVDLGDCLLPGEGVQAVRVSPTNGVPIALVRMRVTLVGAQF